ncbi:hypothetical protein BCR34DRAFT_498530 [Clohesyomyces aquaticus]|uniref:DUF7371 domain-containing protein n=1 Tax=Clohesyomyces aquaticus TaxID=1231657 RepID=A0A1Y1YBH5_9PLEO|nr:hypothetical protein BCR34DRAFT_498530 [Clohesyomyces aquaticus]
MAPPSVPSFQILTRKKRQLSGFTTIISTVTSIDIGLPIVSPTSAGTPAEPTPTLCGETGNFTLGFDDTTVGPDRNGILPINGMTNPYHHLFHANGFAYIPDSWEPYPAVSQPNIAMFFPLAGRLLPNTPFAGTMLPGEIGAGPRAGVNAYWFDAFSGFFGCALNGVVSCTLRISGYKYDSTVQKEVLVVQQSVHIPPCYGYIRCRLTWIDFNADFRALSGIQFAAYVDGSNIPQIFMMDSLSMAWSNNTCSAGILRIGRR